MSRVTKYLKQTCSYSGVTKSNNKVVLNKYGEIAYSTPATKKCRKEPLVAEIQTDTGAIIKSSTRYIFDNSDIIEVEDLLDNKPILKMTSQVNASGIVEGYECYV